MYCVEFFADKTPGVDSGWDAIHTFIRIPAGAVLAAGAVGQMEPAIFFAAGVLGGVLTASVHATKAGSRLMINTSPEPVTNWIASLGEDVLVIVGLWTALYHPVIFLIALGAMIVLMIWLLPKIWDAVRTLFVRIQGFFGHRQHPLSDTKSGDVDMLSTKKALPPGT